MPDPVNANRRRRRAGAHKRIRAHRKAIAKLNGYITRLNRAIRRREARIDGGDGREAVRYLLKYVGKTESPAGSNDAPFLAAWRKTIPSLAWMRGQPWCGFACRAAYKLGAGKDLPDGVVYTPNIVTWAKNGDHFKAVRPEDAKLGDLVVYDFDGGGADHVELALGPARNGMIDAVGGNTSPGNAGSQSNGGGVFKRSRPVGFIAVVARPL